MKVVLASKALTVAAYHDKLVEIARLPDVDLHAVIPDRWVENEVPHRAEPVEPVGYSSEVTPLRMNGRYHLYSFRGLDGVARARRPDLLHIDEEPYNLAAVLGCRAARRVGAPCVFFAWQNLRRSYPPPFRWFERYVFARAAGIAGTESAARVLRDKGFRGRLRVIPQFGVDPQTFAPADRASAGQGFRVGYAGRLIPEKGVDVLIDAAARLGREVEVRIAGGGPAEPGLRRRAAGGSVMFLGSVPSRAMPEFYRSLDVLVQPTVGRRGWTEQFGRSAVEAMSCGVATVVSDSGELPAVVGDGGEVVPAGDAAALAAALRRLRDSQDARRRLGEAGRARVLECFTQARIARETVDFYREILRQRDA